MQLESTIRQLSKTSKFFEKVQIVLEISQFENCQISENPGSGDLYARFGARIRQKVSGFLGSSKYINIVTVDVKNISKYGLKEYL